MPEDISKSDKSKLRKTLENVILFVKKHPGECIFCLLLVVFYYIIYFFFRLGIGFSTGPSLDVSDWLSFLSGYLSFAGAAIMAFLVYKQDKKINELMEKEYEPNFLWIFEGVEKGSVDSFSKDNIIDSPQTIQLSAGKNSYKDAYSVLNYDYDGDASSSVYLKLYFGIRNLSKIPSVFLVRDELTIQDIPDKPEETPKLCYVNRKKTDLNVGIYSMKVKMLPDIRYPIAYYIRFLADNKNQYKLLIGNSDMNSDENGNYFVYIDIKEDGKIFCTDGVHSFWSEGS